MTVFGVCVRKEAECACLRCSLPPCVHVRVHGFASILCVFALCVLVSEQACSLGLWGGVLSADFVWFKARGSGDQ